MGLNWNQFELGVLRPTLVKEPEVAVKLVGETIWHESDRLRALGQYGTGTPFGPGLGIASIEEATWDWMRSCIHIMLYGHEYEELAWDLQLNVKACRLRYLLDPSPLPRLKDGIKARADYWWKVYNASGVASRRVDYVTNAKAIVWTK